MNSKRPHVAFLHALGACSEGQDFAAKFHTMAAAWACCPRPDWMLWILKRITCIDKADAVRISLAATVRVLRRYPGGPYEPLSWARVRATQTWLREKTPENAKAADYAAAVFLLSTRPEVSWSAGSSRAAVMAGTLAMTCKESEQGAFACLSINVRKFYCCMDDSDRAWLCNVIRRVVGSWRSEWARGVCGKDIV